MATKPTETETVEYDALADLLTVAAYVAADRSGRAKARVAFDARIATLTANQTTDMKAGDLPAAMVWLGHVETVEAHVESCKAAAGTSTSTDTFDYRQAISNRVQTLLLAALALETGTVIPDGTPDGTDTSDLPDGTPDVDTARTLAARSLRRSGKLHDLSAIITASFVGKPIGTFQSCGAVRRFAIENGHGAPGTGGLTARVNADEWTGHAGIVQVRSGGPGKPAGFRNVLVITDDSEPDDPDAPDDSDEADDSDDSGTDA